MASTHANGIVIVKEKRIKPSGVDQNAPVEQTFKRGCSNGTSEGKGKLLEENVPMEPMKEKGKPSEGMIFQRKEPCTVEEKTFQIENDKVKLDNVNVLWYYKSFISID